MNCRSTSEAGAILRERGVPVVPDFIANAGGVLCAAVEFHGGTESDAFEHISAKIRRNTKEVLTRARDDKRSPRDAAVRLPQERVLAAMALRS